MEFTEVLKTRRSVNFFDENKPVSAELLKELVETAAMAPSGFNLQPWNLMVLTDPEEKARLRKLAWDQPKVSQAPVVLMVLADRAGWKADHPVFKKDFEKMVEAGMPAEQHDWFVNATRDLYGETAEKQQAFANKNAAFFAMSLMYAATDLGLASHPMDGFDHEAVKKEFNIPENYWIPCLLAVGYFDETNTLNPPKWRKTFEEIVVKF